MSELPTDIKGKVLIRDTIGGCGKESYCYCCNEKIAIKNANTWEFTFIVPLHKGGQYTLSNIVITCKECAKIAEKVNISIYKIEKQTEWGLFKLSHL